MPKPPPSHETWLKSKKSTTNSKESISSDLLQKISDLEKTMSTETGKIMKYLIKVEDESRVRYQEAFRRINDLEHKVIGRLIQPRTTDEKVFVRGEEYSESIRDLGLETDYLDDPSPPRAQAKAKKSKKRKKPTKRKKKKKKQTKRKKR